ADKRSVAFATRSASISAALPRSGVDDLLQPPPRLIVQAAGLQIEKRRQRALRGAAEESVQDVPQRGAARDLAPYRRPVVVPRAVALDAEVSLGDEDPERRADRRVRRRIAHRLPHLGGGRVAARVHDIEDFLLAPAQRRSGTGHGLTIPETMLKNQQNVKNSTSVL